MINIIPTNNIPFKGATITATNFETSQPELLYDASENVSGLTAYSNSLGFLSIGESSVNGLFVKNKSTIVATFNNQTVQWVVEGGGNTQTVYDGKLLNKQGETVFSANTNKNYTLDYSDLANTPEPASGGFALKSYSWDTADFNPNNIPKYGIVGMKADHPGSGTGKSVLINLPPDCGHFDIFSSEDPTDTVTTCTSVLHIFINLNHQGLHTSFYNSRTHNYYLYNGNLWTSDFTQNVKHTCFGFAFGRASFSARRLISEELRLFLMTPAPVGIYGFITDGAGNKLSQDQALNNSNPLSATLPDEFLVGTSYAGS